MKTLRDLLVENSMLPISEEMSNEIILQTEVKNYEFFSKSELESYFNSEKFLEDAYGCLLDFYNCKENTLRFFVLSASDNSIRMVLKSF